MEGQKEGSPEDEVMKPARDWGRAVDGVGQVAGLCGEVRLREM